MSTPVQAELPFKLRLKLLPTLRRGEMWRYFGPAFVASVAYVDPGNFATNIEGGSRFGYSLLWVLWWSNAMRVLIQSPSAKLRIATGKTLPQNCRAHFSRPVSFGLWIAAEVAAIATDLAEFLGAALGLYLLFGFNLFPSALITAVLGFLFLAVGLFRFCRLGEIIIAFVFSLARFFPLLIFFVRPPLGGLAYYLIVPAVSSP